MSDLAKARKALDDALADLSAAVAGSAVGASGGGEGDAEKLKAERDALAGQIADMRAARAKDAAMIEEALADLRKIA